MTTTTTTTTTCERQVCALTDTNERVMRPCIREAGHEGVCRYKVADNLPDEDAMRDRHSASCPTWCTANEVDHDTWVDGGAVAVTHSGPTFGRHFSAASVERVGALTAIEVWGHDLDDSRMDAAGLLDLARDALAAVEWLVAQTTDADERNAFEPGRDFERGQA